MAQATGRRTYGAWSATGANSGWNVLNAAWARVEPDRGRYDAAELERARGVLRDVRKRGGEPVVVVHAGALPDWQIARGGWADPDVLALWGCFVDRLGSALADLVHVWIALEAPLAEAAAYDRDARRVARVLLDAQAAAYLHLKRGPGFGGQPALVGVLERFGPETLAARWRAVRGADPDVLVRILATGRLTMPFAPFGELPNGTPAVDFVGVAWAGGDGLEARLDALWAHRLPLATFGGDPAEIDAAEGRGVRILARVE